jgi:hypothetical protein
MEGETVMDVEKRLFEGAQEIRRKTAGLRPPTIQRPEPRRAPRGWMVMAGVFAAVVAVFGVVGLMRRNPVPAAPAGQTTVAALSPTTTGTVLSTLTAECSSAGMGLPPAQPDLPEAVARVRDSIAEASVACDWTALENLASENFTTSFGGGGFSLLREWEDDGYQRLRIVVALLGMPHTIQHIEDGADIYVWPSAFGYDTWDQIPPEALEPLHEIYTEGELDEIASFGSYAGWRVGITEDGDWRFFVAGD